MTAGARAGRYGAPVTDRAAPTLASWRPSPQLWRAAAYCLKVFLAVRVALFVHGLLVVGLLPQGERVGVPGRDAPAVEGGWQNLWTAWERSDAIWYLRIAADGYRPDDGSAAFFPLFPMLVRAVGWLTGGHLLLAGYLVANLALLGALIVLHRLTALELSEPAARRAVLYVCVLPTSFFLFAPYTESLFLLLSLGALLAARRRRWAVAGLLGLLAALTRSPGVLLALPLACEAVLQWREGPDRRVSVLAARLLAPVATGAGLLLYLGFWLVRYDDPLRPVELQRTGWSKEASLPWHTLWDGLRIGTQLPGSYPGGYFALDLLVVLGVLAAGVWVALRTRPTYAVHLWAGVLLPLLLVFPGRPLLSLPRIYLVLFPVVWALVRLGERYRAHDLVLVVSAMGLGLCSALFVASQPLF